MGFRGGCRRHRVRGAAALALACLALPSAAQASPYVAVAESSVCQVTMTIQLTSPATAVPSSPMATVAYNISGSGPCTGVNAPAFSFFAQGWTTVAPTCAEISSANAFGTVTFSGTYSVMLAFAGPTAATTLQAFSTTPLIGGITVVGPFVLSTASLQACLQAGGTTSLQYVGAVVVTI